jgi:putative membrane protein
MKHPRNVHPRNVLALSTWGLLAAAAGLAGCRAEVDDDDRDDRPAYTGRATRHRSTFDDDGMTGVNRTPDADRSADRPLADDTAWGGGAPLQGTGDRAAAATDADILGVLVAIDDHEVRANADAEKKTLRTEVMDFARTMQTEHKRHAEETRDLAKRLGVSLTDTALVTAQRDKGERARTSLAAYSGDAFERAYLDAMVKDHEEALARLDAFLLTAKRDEIRTHLTSTRKAVASHLEHARTLRTGTGTGSGIDTDR